MRLVPSFWRSTFSVLCILLLASIACYFFQGYIDHKWWPFTYVISLLIPFVIAPVIVWLVFVPVQLEFTDLTLDIQFRFRRHYNMQWSSLT